VLDFGLSPGLAQLLGLIPSSSVSLVRVTNPSRWGYAPSTYSGSWPWESLEELYQRAYVGSSTRAELVHLGVSVREIARRFSDRHPGSKTRVEASLNLWESEVRAVEDGETPWYKERFEEELGNHVDLELILVSYPEYEDDLPDSGTDTKPMASCITIR